MNSEAQEDQGLHKEDAKRFEIDHGFKIALLCAFGVIGLGGISVGLAFGLTELTGNGMKAVLIVVLSLGFLLVGCLVAFFLANMSGKQAIARGVAVGVLVGVLVSLIFCGAR